MNGTQAHAGWTPRLRILPGLMLALTLVSSAIGPIAPAQAGERAQLSQGAPSARYHLVIKSVTIGDDMEWGTGDISINVRVRERVGNCPGNGETECEGLLVNAWIREFQASDGSTTQLDRVVPAYGDTTTDRAISSSFGIPIHANRVHELRVTGFERDPSDDDDLGYFIAPITDQDGRLQVGTFTGRALDSCTHTPGVPEYCTDGNPGAFSVEYEVRMAPVPDLDPIEIKTYDLLGTTKTLVCLVIRNAGFADAGPFEVEFRVDGKIAGAVKATSGRLGSGESGELCAEAVLPTTGEHELFALVDEPDAQLELNEQNNVYRQPYIVTRTASGAAPATDPGAADGAPTSSPPPSPVPGPVAADLSVSAIRLNGRAPNGKHDCKDGKNDLSVVVKNAGTAKAGAFAVRLAVDGNEVSVESVDGLEAGKEREARFDDVRLKKGERALTAVVDAKNTVAESNEENNERKVTARCDDD